MSQHFQFPTIRKQISITLLHQLIRNFSSPEDIYVVSLWWYYAFEKSKNQRVHSDAFYHYAKIQTSKICMTNILFFLYGSNRYHRHYFKKMSLLLSQEQSENKIQGLSNYYYYYYSFSGITSLNQFLFPKKKKPLEQNKIGSQDQNFKQVLKLNPKCCKEQITNQLSSSTTA